MRAALLGARAALIGAAPGDHLPRVRHDDEIPGSAGCGGARAGRYATGRGHGPTYGGCTRHAGCTSDDAAYDIADGRGRRVSARGRLLLVTDPGR